MTARARDPNLGELESYSPSDVADAVAWLDQVRSVILERAYSGRPADETSARSVSLALRVRDRAAHIDAPEVGSRTDLILALAFNGNEDYREAVPHYRSAVAGFESLGENEIAARARLGLTGSLQMTGAYEEAIEVCKAADGWFIGAGDLHGHARAQTNLGNIHHRLDQHSLALQCHLTAREIFEKAGDSGAQAMASLNAANGFAFLDRFDESDAMYQSAERLATGRGMQRLADQAGYNRAYLFFLRGRYSDAIRSFNRLRRLFGNTRSARHAALCDLDQSEIYLHLNLHGEATNLAEQARDRFREQGMAYEEAKASAFLGLAQAQDNHYTAALETFDLAETLFASSGNEFWTGMVELYRSEVLTALGRLCEARFLATGALHRFETLDMTAQRAIALIVLGRIALEGNQRIEARGIADTLFALIRDVDLPLLRFPAHVFRGRIAELEDEPEEALADYGRAASAVEEHRRYLHHDELRVRFLEGKQSVYESLVHLEMEHRPEEPDRAFRWCERAKSRGLSDLLGQHLPSIRTDADPTLLDRVHRLREELNSQYVRMRPDSGDFACSATREQARRTEKELERGLRQLFDADAHYASLIGCGNHPTGEIQASLPAGTTLVEYFIARGEIVAFLLERDSLRLCRRLCPVGHIRQLRQSLEFQIEKCHLDRSYDARHSDRMLGTVESCLGQLYDDLVRPWVEEVDAERIVIVPHGELHGLPFHAFYDGRTHLLDRFPLSFAPSAEVLRYSLMNPRTGSEGEGLLVGLPDAQAPAIAGEISQLRALAPASHVLIDGDATRDAFFRIASRARFVHIASHSFFRGDNPMFSGFQLADGPVTALDLYSCEWASELVALGGCSSGVNRIAAGDDLMGLTRGFLYAGARTLLLSLWDVSDRETFDLTGHFYREWLASGDKAAALRSAMLKVRESHAHPFYWAPFYLTGAP